VVRNSITDKSELVARTFGEYHPKLYISLWELYEPTEFGVREVYIANNQVVSVEVIGT